VRNPPLGRVQINRRDMVELLLAHGAHTDIRDQNGEDVFTLLKAARLHAKARKLQDLVRRHQMEG
jgi:CBS-domain-containing membrane protein